MASNIRYLSTRGESTGASYDEIVLRGLASDGGLFMPESYPQVTAETLESWRKLPYAELAFEVLRLFASGIDEAALKEICRSTYPEKTYCNAREGDDPKDITPVRWLEDGIGLLELSNGPTLAFKDMAMQYLGALFEHLLAREGKTLNILGATSGDTGSAAEYAMRGRKGIRVFMLSPYGRMSDFQRAQMYSLEDPNIFNIAVRGTFDQEQDIVKAVSNDHAFKSAHSIGTVNSINWARVAAQVVYYFKGWLAAAEKGEAISFAVPSGNFGDVLAGWIAKQMGLPIASLIVATNENDVLTEFFETGVYHPRDAAHTYVTSSPSMDISSASNFERFIFDIVGRDPEVLKRLWHVMATEGEFRLTGGGIIERFILVHQLFIGSLPQQHHANILTQGRGQRVCPRREIRLPDHSFSRIKGVRSFYRHGGHAVSSEDHRHRAHSSQRRLFVRGQHRLQPPSGQNVQRKEDQSAEQAQRNRRFVALGHHRGGGGRGGEGRVRHVYRASELRVRIGLQHSGP